MRCVICQIGETKPGKMTVTVQRGETIVLIKDTPAEVCENCGEYYLDEVVTRRVYTQAEEAVQRHAEVAILRYAA
jgi:YgiT-type zinc finger domain-containing protein